MELHNDKEAFIVLLETIHKRTGIRRDVLEKDYYVTLFLKDLAKKQEEGLRAYFKGGTALYKALKTINRFSEDIDISVDVRDCTRTQGDKRLDKATKRFDKLTRNIEEGRTNRSEVIAIYEYNPITIVDSNDSLQRFGKLKIEATSFTISEPVESMEVEALLYSYSSDEEKRILREKYKVFPFNVKTISIERAFVDKLFAAESYTRKSDDTHRAFEAAKHVYDLCVMSHLNRINDLYKNEELLEKLLNIRLEEERGRLDGINGVPPHEFAFFDEIEKNEAIKSAYKVMQKQYVLRPQDYIDYNKALGAISKIQSCLKNTNAWISCEATDNKEIISIEHSGLKASYDGTFVTITDDAGKSCKSNLKKGDTIKSENDLKKYIDSWIERKITGQ